MKNKKTETAIELIKLTEAYLFNEQYDYTETAIELIKLTQAYLNEQYDYDHDDDDISVSISINYNKNSKLIELFLMATQADNPCYIFVDSVKRAKKATDDDDQEPLYSSKITFEDALQDLNKKVLNIIKNKKKLIILE